MQDKTGKDSRKLWDRPRLSKLSADLAELAGGPSVEGSFGPVVS